MLVQYASDAVKCEQAGTLLVLNVQYQVLSLNTSHHELFRLRAGLGVWDSHRDGLGEIVYGHHTINII